MGMEAAICAVILCLSLAAIAWIDLRSLRIPDLLSLPLIGAGLICAQLDHRLGAAALGAVAGYGFMIAVETGYRRLRGRDGLGRGDAKLFAAAGAWCGWAGLPMVLLIASASGLVFALLARRKGAMDGPHAVPFGPFITLGILGVFFLG